MTKQAANCRTGHDFRWVVRRVTILNPFPISFISAFAVAFFCGKKTTTNTGRGSKKLNEVRTTSFGQQRLKSSVFFKTRF